MRRATPTGDTILGPGEPRAARDTAGAPEAWGRSLQRGDPEAVSQVRRRVRRILGSKGFKASSSARDDLEQEVMLDLWNAVNRPGFDLSAGFWGFVELVAARRCIDWLRAQRGKVPLDPRLQDGNPSPFETTSRRETSRTVSRVLEALEPPCRDLIMLRLGASLPYADLTDRFGKSEGALRVQMYRCIERARRAWQEAANDEERQGSHEQDNDSR